MFLKANWVHHGGMVLLLVTLPALAAMLVVMARAILEDGYGMRPPPRSHRAEEELDGWGLPFMFVGKR